MSHTTVDELPRVFHAYLLGAVLTWLTMTALPVHKLVFAAVLTFCAVLAALMLGLRVTVRAVARRSMGPERVMVVGGGPAAAALIAKMELFSEHSLAPVVALGRDAGDELPEGLPTAGTLGEVDLEAALDAHAIDRVVLVGSHLRDDAALELLRRCKELSVKVSVLPSLFDGMGPNMEVDHIGGITVLAVNPPVLPRSSRLLKRAVDVAGASIALLVVSPAIALIALAIKLDSRGPVFFRQERVGHGGRRFRVVKFRSMVSDAESQRDALLSLSKDPGWLHLEHDPRITRLGRFLRQASLDELPQLWNVLCGEMSLVGPRPLIAEEDSRVDGWRRARLDLTPGITGLWQVMGRTAIPFEEMVKLDYMYVTNWSLWSDIRLLLRTLPVVLTRRGVN